VAVFVERFAEVVTGLVFVQRKSTRVSSFYSPTTALLASIASATVLFAGASLAVVDIGTLAAFVLLFQRFYKPFISLGDEWQAVQSSLAGADRIFTTLALPVDRQVGAIERAADVLSPPADSPPMIVMDAVSFGYQPDRLVLHDVSVTIAGAGHVVVVGRTGAGKSTLAHLACGLETPTRGRVRVDGLDPASLSDDVRRRFIGIVPQAVQLFSLTVKENIALSDASISDVDIGRACAITGLASVIEALPQGFDTVIAGAGRGGGYKLSAGQEQLLALTRALAARPRVVILDEPSSQIDAESDARARAAIVALVADGCLVVTVAHRMAYALAANEVLVMKDGCIVERGAPDALMRRAGLLASLVAARFIGDE
ncbi:MAG TPA: ABC transporter ATP-binding protein, partial [Kofleriaceae bacterium]